MKKLLSILILFSLSLSAQVSKDRLKTSGYGWANRVVPVSDKLDSTFSSFWMPTGNSVNSNTAFVGTTNNKSLLFKTNNTQRLKIDSIGLLTLPTNKISTTTKNGSFWYNGNTNNGFNFYSHDATQSGYHSVFSNSVNSLGFYLNTSTVSSQQGVQIGSTSNQGLGFFVNGGATVLGINSNSVYINQPLRVGASGVPSASLHVVGTMSVSSTSTLADLGVKYGTSNWYLGEQSAGSAGLWAGAKTSTSTTNFVLRSDVSNSVFNATSKGWFQINGGTAFTYDATRMDVQNNLYANGTFSAASTSTFNTSMTLKAGSIANSGIVIRDDVGASTYGAIYSGVTPSSTNYMIRSTGSITDLQGVTTLNLNAGGSAGYVQNGTNITLQIPVVTSARFNTKQGAAIASVAGAITLGTDGNVFEITGTNAITLISNTSYQNGSEITLYFTSTATLTDGTANSGGNIGMELAGNVNFVATADDSITLVLTSVGGVQRWREKCRSVN